jgi:restriction endonuclease Mrr
MTLPSRIQLERAILELLYKLGEILISDVYQALANHFSLSSRERLVPISEQNPESRFENAVRQARRSLVHEGLVSRNTPRGIWKLTSKGERVAGVLNSLPRSKPVRPNVVSGAPAS